MQRSPTIRARASNASRSPPFARMTSALCTRLSLHTDLAAWGEVTLESGQTDVLVQSLKRSGFGDVSPLAVGRVDVDAHAPVRRWIDEYFVSGAEARLERTRFAAARPGRLL